MIEDALAFYRERKANLSPGGSWVVPGSIEDTQASAQKEAVVVESMLLSAQRYILDGPTISLIHDLVKDLGDGFWDMAGKVRLPFDIMWVEHSVPEAGWLKEGAIVARTPMGIIGLYMSKHNHVFFPAVAQAALNEDVSGESGETYIAKLIRPALSEEAQVNFEDEVKERADRSYQYVSLTVGLSILLQHRDMLEVTEGPGLSRPERRRLKREGIELPETRVSHIRLGAMGRAQREAMSQDAESGEKGTRRAHWFRGHFMRNRAGGLSWRMPHIRGIGALIGQERYVTSEPLRDDGPEMQM